MARYKLSTGLHEVIERPELDTDKEAWEYLRVKLPNKYATLYKEVEFVVPHNNEESYVPTWNAKYVSNQFMLDSSKLKEIGVPAKDKVWIPILEGITSDEYKI